MKLPINEIFETIQGEATYTGMPSLFIRLQGCDVGCPWCDTKHTWVVDNAHEQSLSNIINKTGKASEDWAYATVDQLVDIAREARCPHVVITGGEPCVYDLGELTGRLIGIEKSVQIETSGTEEVRAASNTWVTVSPKVNMPGGRGVRMDAIRRANEIKMPVGSPRDIIALGLLTKETTCPVWLQPLSMSEKATKLCVQAAMDNGWRVSVQTHKVMGVR